MGWCGVHKIIAHIVVGHEVVADRGWIGSTAGCGWV